MPARRKSTARSRKKKASLLPWGRLAVALLIVAETFWLGLFIYGSGSLLPPGLRLGPVAGPGTETGWDAEKQQELEELQLQKFLSQHGSHGDSELPPAPGE